MKRAILELRQLRARIEHLEGAGREPIAIIGVGLRLPGGAHDEASLWRLLSEGVDAVAEVPPDRWDVAAYYDPDADKPGKMNTRYGAFLGQVGEFDAEFFGVSPREAVSMDPQHRLLLETAWETLENAAVSPARVAGSQTGVFVGFGNSDYWRLVYGDEARIDAYSALGNAYSVAAGRLSYFLGLHGPCVTVDTACSSSLVAVHLACQSLRAGECSLALAAGVSLILTPEASINFSKARMLAPDGRCKTFDAKADGYVRGEGCGVVLLKPLSAALADGNRVLAVIRGSAVNQDGRSGGLTAPNGPAQEAVIRAALLAAGVAPHEVGYVEAHGTGTSLGDPIEARAAGAVFSEGRAPERPLAIGSIKTNIGHLEAAAGVAGLLKVVLALQNKRIPPHLHLENPSPYIEWDRLPIVVPTSLTAWAPINGRRIAGVSSFGFSGTNAHVIVEEAPQSPKAAVSPDRPLHVLALSAKSAEALAQLAREYDNYLGSAETASLADVCFTANAGRAHFAHRLSMTGESKGAMRQGLQAFVRGAAAQNVTAGEVLDSKAPQVAFLFTGDGSHCAGVGRALYESSATFKGALDGCDEVLRPLLGKSLIPALYPKEGEESSLADAAYTHPALFALEYALAELWRSWGVKPSFVMGHGVGEYAAACVAGVISIEEGLRRVVERGRLTHALRSEDRTASVFAGRDPLADSTADSSPSPVAAINGPELVVISVEGTSNVNGEPVRFAQAIEKVAQQGVRFFVEIGPNPAPPGIARRGMEKDGLSWLPSVGRGCGDWQQMLESLQRLYVAGVDIDWAGVDQDYPRRRVVLPGYPFQRRRYWVQRAKTPSGERPPASDKGWRAAQAAGLRQSRNAPLGVSVQTYTAKWRCLEDLTTAQAAHTLRVLGAFSKAGEAWDIETLIERFGIPAMYRYLLQRWLQRLVLAGLLRSEADRFTSVQPLPEPDLAARLAETRQALADDPHLLAYVENCAARLTEVVAGKESPLETLFPGGSPLLAERLYEGANPNRYTNAIVGAVVEAVAGAWPGNRPLRILEVGAGTGGTSFTLLPLLDAGQTTYVFSDVSDLFLSRARERFATFPLVRFAVFDLEKAAKDQGFAENSFDIVIGANAVHAARNLKGALDHLRALLVPGGFLVLAEATCHQAWFDMTTGLIEGWQHFADDLRGDQPLLSPERWQAALLAHGFSEVCSFPEKGSPAGVLGQHVILARAGAHGEEVAGADGITPAVPRMEEEGPAKSAAVQPTPVEPAQEFRLRLAAALPDEREELMNDYVRGKVMAVLQLEPDCRPGLRHRLMDIGLDSLMAVQLRNLLESGLGLERVLPATLMFDYPTIESISAFLLKRAAGPSAAPRPPVRPKDRPMGPTQKRAQEIGALSEDQTTALLLERLDRK
jgi:acyl transferase domain-containing protein/SAM-dependent methyltransferase